MLKWTWTIINALKVLFIHINLTNEHYCKVLPKIVYTIIKHFDSSHENVYFTVGCFINFLLVQI